tara:strand:+ start:12900 stop:13235 length:336 start_codon:yes stop_codon:yes gene_type:complete
MTEKKIRRGAFRVWLKADRLNPGEINGSLMTSGQVVDHQTFVASYVHAVPIHWDWQVRPVSRVSLNDIESLEPIITHTEMEEYKAREREAPAEKIEEAKHHSQELLELEAS